VDFSILAIDRSVGGSAVNSVGNATEGLAAAGKRDPV
jgi:hypothetical protein